MPNLKSNVIKLNQRYLDVDLYHHIKDHPTSVTNLISEKGTAKSTSIAKAVETIKEVEPSASVLVISHRLMLAEALAKDFKCESYLIYDGQHRNMIRTAQHLAICYNSLYRLVDKQELKRFDYVICDESEQIMRHSVDDKVDKLALNFSVFLQLISHCRHLVCADADLGLLTNFVQRLVNRPATLIVKNTFTPKKGRKMYITDKASLSLQYLYTFLDSNPTKNVFIACSSRNQSTEIHKLICARFPGIKTMLVNRENAQLTDTQIFIRDINKRLVSDKIRVLIASPSLGTGVSIKEKIGDDWSNTVFGFFSGQHGPLSTDCLQHICRVRSKCDYYLFVDKSARALETKASEIQRIAIEKPISDGSKVAAAKSVNKIFAEFEQLRAQVISSANRDRKHFYTNFINRAKAEGYDIQLIESADFEGEGLKRGDEQKKYIADLIAHAATHEVLSKGQVAQMREKGNLTKDERLTLQISEIAHTMLSSDKPALYSDIETYIKKKVGKALRGNGALLTADKERLAELDRKQLMTEDVWRHDVAKNMLAPKAMLLKKVFKYIPGVEIKDNKVTVDPEQRFTNDSLKKNSFRMFLERNTENLKAHLNITVNKSTVNQPINFVRNILEGCGLHLESEKIGRMSDTERLYNVKEQSANIVNAFAENDAATTVECRIKHKPVEAVTTSLEAVVAQTPAKNTSPVAMADDYEGFISHISDGICDKKVARYLYSTEDYELQRSGKTRHTLEQLQTFLQANAYLFID